MSAILIVISLFVLTSCGSEVEKKDPLTNENTTEQETSLDSTAKQKEDTPAMKVAKDTLLYINDRDIPVLFDIRVPQNEVNGCILLLHGWNFPQDDWCTKMTFCDKALSKGFVLIMPSFGKTTYQWELYPETIEKYRSYPSRQWMYDTALMELQSLGLLLPGQNNFVAGISTGGRGAAFFALEHPDVFRAAAPLSGDFDQTKLPPGEPINTGFYGSMNAFEERWTGRDNIYNRAAEYTVPTWFGHGTQDKVCATFHSTEFAERLTELHPDLVVEVDTPALGHDYVFWEDQTDKILSFFERFLQ